MSTEFSKPDRIFMSQRGRDILKIMHPVLRGQRTQAEAARLLKLTVRQVRRIQRKLEGDEDQALVHSKLKQTRNPLRSSRIQIYLPPPILATNVNLI